MYPTIFKYLVHPHPKLYRMRIFSMNIIRIQLTNNCCYMYALIHFMNGNLMVVVRSKLIELTFTMMMLSPHMIPHGKTSSTFWCTKDEWFRSCDNCILFTGQTCWIKIQVMTWNKQQFQEQNFSKSHELIQHRWNTLAFCDRLSLIAVKISGLPSQPFALPIVVHGRKQSCIQMFRTLDNTPCILYFNGSTKL